MIRTLQPLFPTTQSVRDKQIPTVTTMAGIRHDAPASLGAVMACIKAHESGDYTIHNHGPNGSSGAFQIIGSTWRAWSVRAGYGGYSAAYLASPAVQDAVVLFMLTHGGAHNWDPSYGNDPCTVSLP